jgi:hypothetical protein
MWAEYLLQFQEASPDGCKHMKLKEKNPPTHTLLVECPLLQRGFCSVSPFLWFSRHPLKPGWRLPWPDRSWNQSESWEEKQHLPAAWGWARLGPTKNSNRAGRHKIRIQWNECCEVWCLKTSFLRYQCCS